jgi:hypothetical protein
MGSYSYMELLASAQAAGTNLVSFTTAASSLPSHAITTIGPDEWAIGKALWIHAAGRVSNVVTAQPTFTFQLMLGPTSNIIAWTSGAVLTSTTAHTTVPWTLDVQLTCRSVGGGTSGTLMGQGQLLSRAFLDTGATADLVTGGHSMLLVPETTPAVGTGFSTNAANVADLFIACSVSNAANAIQVEQYWLGQMN